MTDRDALGTTFPQAPARLPEPRGKNIAAVQEGHSEGRPRQKQGPREREKEREREREKERKREGGYSIAGEGGREKEKERGGG